MTESTNKLLTIYLAAGMGTGEDWRLKVMKACREYRIEWLVPIDTIVGTAKSLIKTHSHKKLFHIADIYKIEKSDILIAYFTSDSPSRFSGTSFECGYARGQGKTVFVINDMKPTDACFYELVKRCADVYCVSLEEGIEKLKEFLNEIGYLPKGVGAESGSAREREGEKA